MVTDHSLIKWQLALVYARVSSDGQSVDQQLGVLKPWVTPQAVAAEFTSEEESSAEVRPKLEALHKRLLNAEADAIVVWKLDRIARNTEELLRWRAEADYVGFNIVSVSESIDLKTPAGRLMYTILAAFSEYERDVIRQRTQMKLDHLRAKGIVGGAVRKDKKINRPYDEAKARKHWADPVPIRELARIIGTSPSTAARIKKEFSEEASRPTGVGAFAKLRPMRMEEMDSIVLAARIKAMESREQRLLAAVKTGVRVDPDAGEA